MRRLDQVEERTSKLKDKTFKITEEEEEKEKKNEEK